ncbi:DMT family transporter [Nocardiopsis sp. YSL2]|uniref:DMT family transporter n=1 Tax=Nocardiopsis sp. YSL2 TaxID=2939492 RepID=UPI0026F4416D|nr:DMT family transporter [Nocardiopsis sp. YSL2]
METSLIVGVLLSLLIFLVSRVVIPEIFQEIGGKSVVFLTIAPVWVAIFVLLLLMGFASGGGAGRLVVGGLLVAAFLLLWGVSEVFGRRWLRICAFLMLAVGGTWAFWPSWPLGEPVWLDGAPQGGWAAALVIALVLAYLWLERIASREPRVHVAEPAAEDNEATRLVLNELRLRLPAIEVVTPAWKPGGEPGEAVASIVESSDIKGNQLVSALARLFSRVVRLPSYTVRVRADEGAAPVVREDASASDGDRLVSVTVDVYESVTERSEHQITLPPLRMDAAATRAAGFVASRIFLKDASTREWARARFDGEDLSAYLTVKSPFSCQGGWNGGGHDYAHDFDPRREERRRSIERLERVAASRRVAGVVRYELASLYELEGEHVKALRLHALNRAQFWQDPFERSEYRLVVLLKMTANFDFVNQWSRATEADRRDIFHALRRAGIYPRGGTFPLLVSDSAEKAPTEQEFAVDLKRDSSGDLARRMRLVLLHIAKEEARGIEKYHSWPRMAFEGIRDKGRNRHRTLNAENWHDESLMTRCKLRKRSIEVLKESIDARIDLASGRVPSPCGSAAEQLWRALPPRGNELYNQACLRAVREVEPFCDLGVHASGDDEAATSGVVDVMREALHPSVCEHYRPSELLVVDPDLRCLRGRAAFDGLVEEQLRRDWGPAKPDTRPAPGDRLMDDWLVQRIDDAWPGVSVRH